MPGGVMLPEFYNQLVALWGESIRFTVPMLVALAFLPMFGIGGLTGLPLGLAASDVSFHDTYLAGDHRLMSWNIRRGHSRRG